jgi:hypothetical protein
VEIHGQQLDRLQLRRRTGSTESVGGVRQVVLDDGAGRGTRVLEFRTAAGLAFDVVVDRAMDIGAASLLGRSFGWRSGVGTRHPGLYSDDESGLGWLRGFDGLLVTAGLDHALAAAEVDGSHFRYDARGSLRQPLHGRLSHVPARLTGAGESWTGDRCVLWAEGEVRQVAVFGEHLVLRRRVEADLDGAEIRISDVVTNKGFDATTHMYLYHVNFGWPLVDEGTRLLAPLRRVSWSSSAAGEQGQPYDVVGPPRPGMREQVYQHEPVAAPDGTCTVVLVRADGELGVALSWDLGPMPHLLQWLHLREGAYAVGLEPSTHGAGGAEAARAEGTTTWLGPGESRSYRLTIRPFTGPENADAAVAQVRAVGDQPADLNGQR